MKLKLYRQRILDICFDLCKNKFLMGIIAVGRSAQERQSFFRCLNNVKIRSKGKNKNLGKIFFETSKSF